MIDKIDRATGVATSIKSVNLANKTYQTASNLRSLLKGYLNDLAEFKGAAFDGVRVLATDIKQKVLRVAIPPSVRYRATKAQLDVLDEIRKAADQKGIRLIIEEVGG